MAVTRDSVRLAVSRHAARLFLERGVRGTSGDDIAVAAGISTRTLWRYFRNKESCVEPLFAASALRFTAMLREWPRNVSIEAYLRLCLGHEGRSPEEIADDKTAVRLVAMLPEEPDLRAAWLMSAQVAEEGLIEVIADRLERSVKDAEVRLCAATVTAAIRVVDETMSTAAVRHGQNFTKHDAIDRLGRAIRAASTLPICDPVVS
jgi:AcrR family transcriptional regulator